jgi:hypothetical protein
VSSDLTTDITGLITGTLYYFWARTHNVKGWSPWGPRSQTTTLRIPNAPLPPTPVAASQFSVVATFPVASDNGGSSIIEYQLGYNTSTTGPSSTATASPGIPNTISGLLAGTRYYFWLRVRNSVGWSSWSNPSNVRTLSGVRIKVGSEWKEAIPYVNVSGVWTVAKPWVKIMGVWKETT